MSADTASSLFPDRPIRPLPKRRIRERLTPDAAARINFPVVLQSTAPVFLYPPYSTRDEDTEPPAHPPRNRPAESGSQNGRRSGLGHSTDVSDAGLRRNVVSRPVSEPLGRVARLPTRQELARQMGSQAPPSAGSSADGYYDEPFENAIETPNNKKKRKVPTTGDTALNGSHSTHHAIHSVDMPGTPAPAVQGQGGLSSPTTSTYYTAGGLPAGNPNVSGPGRGRYGRVRNGRSPLRTLSDSAGNWPGKPGKLRPSQWTSPTTENTGIISTAIANAEKFPSRQDQESQSLGLLYHQQRENIDPASTEFTFTCDSQVPGGIAWPSIQEQSIPRIPGSIPGRRTGARIAAPMGVPYPTSGQAGYQNASVNMTGAGQSSPAQAQASASAPAQAPARLKPSRRQVHQEIDRQARARMRKQEIENVQKGITRDQVQLCNFCLYEACYGEPPSALIRWSERKVRKQLQKEEERRRRIENAKKSRKSKNAKANKTSGRSSIPSQGPEDCITPQGETHAPSSPAAQAQSQGTESEGYPDGEEHTDADVDECTARGSRRSKGINAASEPPHSLQPPLATPPEPDDSLR